MANIWYIQVNRHCNNGCHFCSNPSNGSNITYEKWIELIDDFILRDYKGIIFTGWEPTLSPDLFKWIEYANSRGLENRMISNGMMCSSTDFVQRLADSWLELVHFSVYSCYEKIHDFLTDTPWSWKKLMMSITNALNSWIRVQINMVINHYSENHLDRTVQFLSKTFPPIQHFVWNNLDPEMMRKTDIAWTTLPDFNIFKCPLSRAMKFLDDSWRTFRVERVPLCYMEWFEWASTETRKIVKSEQRIVHFLDHRNTTLQEGKYWVHDKLDECTKCDLNSICSGIYLREEYFSDVKVSPQKRSSDEKTKIIDKILHKIH